MIHSAYASSILKKLDFINGFCCELSFLLSFSKSSRLSFSPFHKCNIMKQIIKFGYYRMSESLISVTFSGTN
ncbi:hypothetical protein HanXRQr2_Chr13g0619361 [Helianthus annuus]|uniref:Uncharacterized protein n=1 Tax=Helianthus annuus TaxID=4232 RepID=A0A251UF99_HELAN|nr:hypothetical protein HanXRQr2_Chr13g0619361 [Helianthus annuus]KAJ0851655.1 hypothetical protein HanPSC8_Chr13g0594561 [Helianthus annuus]